MDTPCCPRPLGFYETKHYLFRLYVRLIFVEEVALLTRPSVIDDGERVFKTFDLVGKAFLAMLNVLDRAGQLKSNSDFKDLALVISLYLKFFKDNIDDMDDMDGATKCHLQIIKYAQDHKIDLVKNGVAGVKEQLESKKAEVDAQKKWPKEGADRWGFKAAVGISHQ